MKAKQGTLWAHVRDGAKRPRKGDNPATFHTYRRLVERGEKWNVRPKPGEKAYDFARRVDAADKELQQRMEERRSRPPTAKPHISDRELTARRTMNAAVAALDGVPTVSEIPTSVAKEAASLVRRCVLMRDFAGAAAVMELMRIVSEAQVR